MNSVTQPSIVLPRTARGYLVTPRMMPHGFMTVAERMALDLTAAKLRNEAHLQREDTPRLAEELFALRGDEGVTYLAGLHRSLVRALPRTVALPVLDRLIQRAERREDSNNPPF